MLVRGNQVRLFNQKNVNTTNIDDFLYKKVYLYVEETTIIPPNFVGHISIIRDGNVREVFVDLNYRNWNNNFHIILPSIINMNNSYCIANISDKPVCYEKGRVLARAYTCVEYSKIPYKTCLTTNIRKTN